MKINIFGAFFGTVLLYGIIMMAGELCVSSGLSHVVMTLLTAAGLGVIFKITEDIHG